MSAEATWTTPDITFPPERSEYDQLKVQFLASLSHELRTPLNGVVGMSEMLLETGLDEEQQEYVQILRECAGQLSETLNSVLDYAALSAGDFAIEETEFHLRSLLDSVADEIRPRAEAKGLLLVTAFDRAMPETLIGDARYLRQLILHLLRNAVKFTPQGHVELKVDIEPIYGVRVSMRISVKDTGIGIPPEKLRTIFESFRQVDNSLSRNHNGLGLGLALAEKITTLLRGEIQVDSQPGKGSTFAVRVPFRVPTASLGMQAFPADNGRALAAGLRRVLVVDDNKIAQQVVKHILERAHYEVACADSGEDALQMAKRDQFDVVIMDLKMPGLDGFATTTKLRQVPGFQSVPVIAMTANFSDQDRTFSQTLGMQGFLVKPIQKEDLLNSLRPFLR
ncbi:MAG: response regulator [Bryobacterales bacterium]|nr:response regulator [Bryobacterales bacterium]